MSISDDKEREDITRILKIKRDYFTWHFENYKNNIPLIPADIADYWLDILDRELEVLENKYENCPQCTGLRDIALEEQRKRIREEISYELGDLRVGDTEDMDGIYFRDTALYNQLTNLPSLAEGREVDDNKKI